MNDVVPARLVALDQLEKAEWNANRVPPKTLAKIRKSIETFGFVENLVARPHPTKDALEVLSGNHRLEIARELGIAELSVVVVDVDDAHARILAQTLNRTRGADDALAYAKLLDEVLEQMSRDEVLSFLPETDASLERAMARLGKAQAGDPNQAPPLPATAESQPGEVYELGPHRLICGDSTDLETFAALMGDERAAAVVTDPPYNVDYHGAAGAIANDAMPEDRFRAFLVDALAGACAYASAGAPIYVWHADTNGEAFRAALRESGWLYKQSLVWVKSALVLGRQDYQWRHEPCLYGWKPGAAHRWFGGFAETTVLDDEVDPKTLTKPQLLRLVDELRNGEASTVLRYPKPSASDLHPTMKPVEMLERLLWNSSERGDVVLDPFLGSGSTLIAADRTGRRCFGAELDPRFCDVIRQRYADHAAAAEAS